MNEREIPKPEINEVVKGQVTCSLRNICIKVIPPFLKITIIHLALRPKALFKYLFLRVREFISKIQHVEFLISWLLW